MGSLSSDPTSLTTSKLKPQNQVNRQVRADAVIGKKGEGGRGSRGGWRRKRGHILWTESFSSSEPTLHCGRELRMSWRRSVPASARPERAEPGLLQATLPFLPCARLTLTSSSLLPLPGLLGCSEPLAASEGMNFLTCHSLSRPFWEPAAGGARGSGGWASTNWRCRTLLLGARGVGPSLIGVFPRNEVIGTLRPLRLSPKL